MQTVNPVEIICRFLKSEDGRKIMASLGERRQYIKIGVIDKGKSRILLTEKGFRNKLAHEETEATAYDVDEALETRGLSIEDLSSFLSRAHRS